MSKPSSGGMHHKSDRKTRGHTTITDTIASQATGENHGPNPTTPNVPEVMRTETNRPVTDNGGQGKHRGDRRDMSKTYSGNTKHAARGSTPRADVKTRKR